MTFCNEKKIDTDTDLVKFRCKINISHKAQSIK